MHKLFLYVSLFVFSLAASAKEAINVDANGVALQGYDPVAYFTDDKPVKGKPEFTASFKGAKYHFASAEHKAAFEKEPAKYEPQFGGFCGYAASLNQFAAIMPEYFQVLNGRLILQHNQKAWDLWHKDIDGNLTKADANWPALKQQTPPKDLK